MTFDRSNFSSYNEKLPEDVEMRNRATSKVSGNIECHSPAEV